MTCREKLAIERPEEIDPERLGGCDGCPHTYGYAKEPEWCDDNNFTDEKCRSCWDREVDGVETDAETKVDNEGKTEVETDVDSGIKSSGEMTVFASGAVRDMHEGKGDRREG